jgi:hypothetical protein
MAPSTTAKSSCAGLLILFSGGHFRVLFDLLIPYLPNACPSAAEKVRIALAASAPLAT